MTYAMPPLDSQIADLLTLYAKGEPLETFDPPTARALFRAMGDGAPLPPIGSVEPAVVPGPAGDIDVRIYRPIATGSLPTVVMFHGGGWVVGDLDTHEDQARNLANLCEAVVVSVDYRLAPEHPFPAAYEDALAAVRWAVDNATNLGGDGRVAVAGDSAGGNLSAVVAQVFAAEGRELAGQLLIYPATDMTSGYPSYAENGHGYFLELPTMKWFSDNYVGAADRSDPRLSPIKGRLRGLAPAVVVTAEFDPLRDEGIAYAKALESSGVPTTYHHCDGLIHGFFAMGQHSQAAQVAIEETCALFRTLLHG
ncbi:alpha/beta hydrolase [Nocardioides sp. CCNWLW239]|uniref:alpha/beta hydrolase n=1 Tax=Nocardioides sp. CCNWLW239 TaxID=3128902 RepID=UPI00301758B8